MGKKRTIRTFAWASFFNDLGSNMIFPIWPLFITGVLGAPMTILGLIDGLGMAFYSISQAVSGCLSDILKRRKIFVWLGYLFGSLSRIGYAFSTTWAWLIPFHILDRTGKMRDAPRDAIIADVSNRKNRAKNFGFLEAMDYGGAVIGIILCIILFAFLGYKKLFLLAAIPSIFASLLVFTIIKEKKPDKKIHKGMKIKEINPNFKLFLFLSILFALASFSYSFLLVFAKEFGFAVAFVPVLYLLFTAVASGLSYPFGKLADKTSRKAVLSIAFILWLGVCLLFIFFQNKNILFLTFIVYGLHLAALKTSQKTFVSELAPVNHKASGIGTFNMFTGLAALPASFMAGLLWDKINLFVPFIISAAITVIVIILLLFVKEQKE